MLHLEGPLVHTPQLAAAVASWSTLPSLRELRLELDEIVNGTPEIENLACVGVDTPGIPLRLLLHCSQGYIPTH